MFALYHTTINPLYVELFLGTWFVQECAPGTWNLNFHIWYEVETWTSDRPWQKETIEDVITFGHVINMLFTDQKQFSDKATWSAWLRY